MGVRGGCRGGRDGVRERLASESGCAVPGRGGGGAGGQLWSWGGLLCRPTGVAWSGAAGEWLVGDREQAVRLGGGGLEWRGVFAEGKGICSGLAVGADGRVCAVWREPDRVEVYGADGARLREIGGFERLCWVEVDGRSNAVFVEWDSRRLRVVNMESGEEEWAGKTAIEGAEGVAVDGAGRVLVVSQGGVLAL